MKSAGILAYRFVNEKLEFFLIHPGGPFWKNKDQGAWSIPKGEYSEGEAPLQAAIREFHEETGYEIQGDFIELAPVLQKGGKLVYAWGVMQDIDAEGIQSNSFTQEWPYKSGRFQTFPEVDKASWFSIEEAKEKINPAQAQLIDDLVSRLQSK